MAAPAHYDGEVVGALVLGIPLWRLQQRLSKQLQMEEAGKSKKPGTVLWVYLYRGDELHHHGTPRDLDQIVPDAKARKAGLAHEPGRLHRRGRAVTATGTATACGRCRARAGRWGGRVPDGPAVAAIWVPVEIRFCMSAIASGSSNSSPAIATKNGWGMPTATIDTRRAIPPAKKLKTSA